MANKFRISWLLFLVVVLHNTFIAMEVESKEVYEAPSAQVILKATGVVPNALKLKAATDSKVTGSTLAAPVNSMVQVSKTEGFALGGNPVKAASTQDFYEKDRDTFSGLENKGDVILAEKPKREYALKVKDESTIEGESKAKVGRIEKTKEFMSLDTPPLTMNSLGDAGEYVLRVVFNKGLGCRTKMQKQAFHESKKAAKAHAEQQVRDTKMKELQTEIEELQSSIKQDESVKTGNYWSSYLFTDSATQHSDASIRIAASKTALGTKLSELTALQKESGIEVVLTAEQDRQQVIDGIRKIMSNGAADKIFLYLKDWFPKYITTENMLSLEGKVNELNSLKMNLNPVSDKDIIDEIDKIAKLLNGLKDKSTAGLVATTARALPVYNNELTPAVVPTGYDIWMSTLAPKDVTQQKVTTA